MSDQLLVVLRVCLLVFMYIVFLRILRVVWVELRGSASARVGTAPVPLVARAPVAVPAPVAAGSGTVSGSYSHLPVLLVIEPPALAGATYVLDAETTIGRASGCRISIDDTHVSKVHARVFVHEGRWFVEDLGSTNGTLVNEVIADGAALVEPGDHIRVGETVLELQ